MKNPNRGARRLLLLAAAFAVAAGAWLLVTQQDRKAEGAAAPSAEDNAEAQAVDTATAEPEHDPPATEGVSKEPSQPAPPSTAAGQPVDTRSIPVVELLDLLGERARAGDPKAACRLGQALNECRMRTLLSSMQPAYQPKPPQSDSPALEQYIELEAARQEDISRWARVCGGLGRDAMREGIAFSAQAALAGHSGSLIAFLQAPLTASADFILDPRLAEIYRTQMWPVLLRALRAGDPQATVGVITQLANPTFSPLEAVIPEQYQDAEAALAILGMLSRKDPNVMRGFHSGEPPSAEAIEVAARWVDELFGGRLPDLLIESRATGQMPPIGSPDTCDSPDAWINATGP